jgi:hypothetical protein
VEEVLTEVGEVVTKNSWLGMGTAKVRLPAGMLLRPLMTSHGTVPDARPFKGAAANRVTALREAQHPAGKT